MLRRSLYAVDAGSGAGPTGRKAQPDPTRNARSITFRARRKEKLELYETTLKQIRDDSAIVRTLDDAIAAAAVALTKRHTAKETT